MHLPITRPDTPTQLSLVTSSATGTNRSQTDPFQAKVLQILSLADQLRQQTQWSTNQPPAVFTTLCLDSKRLSIRLMH